MKTEIKTGHRIALNVELNKKYGDSKWISIDSELEFLKYLKGFAFPDKNTLNRDLTQFCHISDLIKDRIKELQESEVEK